MADALLLYYSMVCIIQGVKCLTKSGSSQATHCGIQNHDISSQFPLMQAMHDAVKVWMVEIRRLCAVHSTSP